MSTAHANTQQFRIFIYSLASDSYFLFFAPLSLSLPATCRISLKTYRDFMCMHNIYFFLSPRKLPGFFVNNIVELIFEREKCCSFPNVNRKLLRWWPEQQLIRNRGAVRSLLPSKKKKLKQQLVDSIITKKNKQIASRKPWKTLNASCLR